MSDSVMHTLGRYLVKLDHGLSSHYVARKLYPNHYARTKTRNWLRTRFYPASAHKFLFILCPPYAGSTLLHELMSTSPSVSCNHERGNREGQRIPEVRPLMWDHGSAGRWDERLRYDWPSIRQIWMKYWDVTRPLLLEKSPPNLIRAIEMERHFEPAYFVCLIRNPYAQCESVMRRGGSSAEAAAEFTIRCFEHQKRNTLNLRNTLLIRYEDLVADPEGTCGKLVSFVPELRTLDHAKSFAAHNYLGKRMPIKDLNAEKIGKLSERDLGEINRVLGNRPDIVGYFGYELI